MSKEHKANDNYADDPRIPCKYGVTCYQKNPVHHQKYKHPPGTKVITLLFLKSNYLLKFQETHSNRHITKKFKAETGKKKKILNITEDSDCDSSNDEHTEKPIETHNEKVKINNDVSDSDKTNSDISDCDNTDQKEENEICADIHSGNKIYNSDISNVKCKKTEDSNEDELEDSADIFKLIDESDFQNIAECKNFIKENFLVDMPTNFFNFWNFCKKLKNSNPQEALKDVGLILVGPFDVLAGKHFQ